LTFSAVGQAGGQPTATFVARFTTFTYAGILLGPGLISAAAELVGLMWTLAALAPMLCLVSTLTRLPSPPPRVAATASAGTAEDGTRYGCQSVPSGAAGPCAAN
jgi:hypothetical protein